MKHTEYFRTFTDRDMAFGRMRRLNQTSADRTIYCLVDGPGESEWTVCDSRTAIDIGVGYTWSL